MHSLGVASRLSEHQGQGQGRGWSQGRGVGVGVSVGTRRGQWSGAGSGSGLELGLSRLRPLPFGLRRLLLPHVPRLRLRRRLVRRRQLRLCGGKGRPAMRSCRGAEVQPRVEVRGCRGCVEGVRRCTAVCMRARQSSAPPPPPPAPWARSRAPQPALPQAGQHAAAAPG